MAGQITGSGHRSHLRASVLQRPTAATRLRKDILLSVSASRTEDHGYKLDCRHRRGLMEALHREHNPGYSHFGTRITRLGISGAASRVRRGRNGGCSLVANTAAIPSISDQDSPEWYAGRSRIRLQCSWVESLAAGRQTARATMPTRVRYDRLASDLFDDGITAHNSLEMSAHIALMCTEKDAAECHALCWSPSDACGARRSSCAYSRSGRLENHAATMDRLLDKLQTAAQRRLVPLPR